MQLITFSKFITFLIMQGLKDQPKSQAPIILIMDQWHRTKEKEEERRNTMG